MSFPKYPEYKASGVEWLGEVPAHWAIERLKLSTVSCQNGIWGNDAQGDENDVICVRVADFDRGPMRVKLGAPTYRNITEAEFKSREVISGDLLLEKSGGGEKQPVGFVVLYDHPVTAICANFIARMRLASGMNSSFWRYVHAAGYAIGLNIPSIKQTSGIQNLDHHSYLNERAAFPPSIEQDRIAAFLDHETACIDALIAEQKRLIDLLKEKRQAVISHAVTKGLDPDVPMKASGVEWLGEVPAHWKVGGLTRFIGPVVDYRGRTPEKVDDGIFLVTARNIRNGKIDYGVSTEYVDAESARSLLERGRPKIGDLLFTMEAPLGQVALVDREDIAVAQRVVKFRGVNGVMDNRYLMLWIMGSICQARLETLATGSTALGIKASKLSMIECLLPPVEEQAEIFMHIQKKNRELDRLLDEAAATNSLLQERRSALISATVTGKIDVRGWQPPVGASAPSQTTDTALV